jgi:hypothetical protein
MTTKKILLIAGGVVAVLGLVVVLFVGGIVWVAFSAIGKSEATQTAKTFLQQNERLKSDIGDVRDFGFWVTGNINSHNADGEATLNLKVIGARKTVPASVNLTYRNGRDWVVVAASYTNDEGQTVELIDKYEQPPPVVVSVEDPEYIKEIVGTQYDNKVLAADEPVVVIFTTTGMETRRLLPELNEIAREYSPHVKFYSVYVDVGNVLGHNRTGKALAELNGVEIIPTLILYRHGKESNRIEGAHSAAEYSLMLEKLIKK